MPWFGGDIHLPLLRPHSARVIIPGPDLHEGLVFASHSREEVEEQRMNAALEYGALKEQPWKRWMDSAYLAG